MSDPAKKLATLIKKLRSAHEGEAAPEPAKPPECFEESDPIVLQFVFSSLLYDATTGQAMLALKRLREGFVDLNELRVSMPEEIAEHLGERYPKALERAVRLRCSLNELFRREHSLTMQKLVETPKRDARAYLDSLEGMVPFVAARVFLVCLGGHAAPLDERLRALLANEGAMDESPRLNECESWLERHVRANEALETHALLQHFSDNAAPPKKGRDGAESAEPKRGARDGGRTRKPGARKAAAD